jgi:carbonic anhydrase
MKQSVMGPEWAMSLLLEGNARFSSDRSIHPHQDARRRAATTDGQSPFAVIVTCSDSRVSPEVVFDRGIGDLFVIRTAGNVVDDVGLGSIEYAVAHLGVSLIMVLGHASCGAVKASLDGVEEAGHISALVEAIAPAVEQARAAETPGSGEDLHEAAIKANVRNVVSQLETSEPVLRARVDDKALLVVGGYYDLESGRVDPVR